MELADRAVRSHESGDRGKRGGRYPHDAQIRGATPPSVTEPPSEKPILHGSTPQAARASSEVLPELLNKHTFRNCEDFGWHSSILRIVSNNRNAWTKVLGFSV